MAGCHPFCLAVPIKNTIRSRTDMKTDRLVRWWILNDCGRGAPKAQTTVYQRKPGIENGKISNHK